MPGTSVKFRHKGDHSAQVRDNGMRFAERDPMLALRFVEAVKDAIRRIVEAESGSHMHFLTYS